MAVITGIPGDDELFGTASDDLFRLFALGDFVASGLEGNDRVEFRGNFTAADKVDGGSGRDFIVLNGDYSGANTVTFAADTMVGVEIIGFLGGHSYELAPDNANVATGETLSVKASGLGASDALTFDGSAESDGRFELYGGAGDDALTGGAGDDLFSLTGGDDTAQGGQGDDRFGLVGAFSAADRIDGGLGQDTASLLGDYTGAGAVIFAADSMVGVEELILRGNHSYDLTIHDATVASGQLLVVNASKLQGANTLTFDASAETDGAVAFNGGAGDDVLTGGAGDDFFALARGGIDTAFGRQGDDTFRVGAALTAADAIRGGADDDTLILKGTYQDSSSAPRR